MFILLIETMCFGILIDLIGHLEMQRIHNIDISPYDVIERRVSKSFSVGLSL